MKRKKGSISKPNYEFIWFFDNFCKKLGVLIPMGFNPLIYKYLEQWVETHWTINAEIVKEPFILLE